MSCHSLYAVFDKKSGVAEYFIASCEEDAMRIFAVMMSSSRPMYEFSNDFALLFVQELPDGRFSFNDLVIVDGEVIRRRLDALREERDNAKG